MGLHLVNMRRRLVTAPLLSLALVVATLIALPARGQSDRAAQRAQGPQRALPTFLPTARRGDSAQGRRPGRDHSVARLWNEALLEAIRRDTPRPPIHARNLFHVSAAIYDAWAAYDPRAVGYFRNESVPGRFSKPSQEAAISYAAYRVLSHRFAHSPGHADSQRDFDALMKRLGHDPHQTSTHGFSPAAVGNRIAQSIIQFGLNDGSNEPNGFADTTGYSPVNEPLVVDPWSPAQPIAINRWQPLVVPLAFGPQAFLTPHWNNVFGFALPPPDANGLYHDPGAPPMLGGEGHDVVMHDILQVIRASSSLDPDNAQMIDISPSVVGNNPLGTQHGSGHAVNPATGAAYPANLVLAGDWGRVLAEFWADGPLSTTPPGHWNEIANAVSDHALLEKRIGGSGPVVSDLEWDVKLHFALNAALHDSAIATWGIKAYYDYGRPLSVIRQMAAYGQSSDEGFYNNYHPLGLPLEPGLIEVITEQSSAVGQRHEHLKDYLGECAIYAWRGHPADPLGEYAGAGWILGVHWLPYQQATFVTPPFAGYTSGHSAFSRAAAEVLTLCTGDSYFPGGVGEFLAMPETGGFDLGFEYGPLLPVPLQWATYYDAADEAGISRIYGGIHPALDDFPGRIIGSRAGVAAALLAFEYFDGSQPASSTSQ